MPEAALDKWQPVWNAQVSISTHVCVNFELRPGAGDIHIFWFNFYALSQGNAYKPTKEPINYRGPGGDRTRDFQTKEIRHIHTYIHTYMFVVVNFDALAQTSDTRI